MIKKIKIQKPKIPISLNDCDDVINEILDYEKLEETLVENTQVYGIENLSVSLNSCVFKNVVFEYCDFRRIDMTDVIFENCDISNINLSYSSLYRAEFINCKLTGCTFNDSTLKSVVFKNCLGRYSNFAYSKFSGVNIEDSDFSFAVFQEIENQTLLLDSNNLTKSVFTGTSLKNVDFTNSNIDGIELRLKDVCGGTFSVEQALDLSKLMGINIK
ncbi:pentapeptide repeat-containing protein [Romboutsia sp. 13368]|uniref:pentapeptide repeat-containing protein n=1 Tax=Romboutsia sp. 13368 TaxID=2708053 RepID=UPI0025D8DC71|nr:pentapeptide repeat-containing protein [Romboutsia sp. 13368]